MSATTIAELKLSKFTKEALAFAGFKSVEEILQAPDLVILKIPKFARRPYNELVTTLVAEGFLDRDACRWGQVPHREIRILGENCFGQLTNSWLATFSQPGFEWSVPAY